MAADKQGNIRDGFVAVVGLTLLERSPISGLNQVVEQSGINALSGPGSERHRDASWKELFP
jgi:hypothetical protein